MGELVFDIITGVLTVLIIGPIFSLIGHIKFTRRMRICLPDSDTTTFFTWKNRQYDLRKFYTVSYNRYKYHDERSLLAIKKKLTTAIKKNGDNPLMLIEQDAVKNLIQKENDIHAGIQRDYHRPSDSLISRLASTVCKEQLGYYDDDDPVLPAPPAQSVDSNPHQERPVGVDERPVRTSRAERFKHLREQSNEDDQ